MPRFAAEELAADRAPACTWTNALAIRHRKAQPDLPGALQVHHEGPVRAGAAEVEHLEHATVLAGVVEEPARHRERGDRPLCWRPADARLVTHEGGKVA